MKKRLFIPLLLACTLVVSPSTALAGDAATVIFENGIKVYLNNGFKQIETGINKSANKNIQNYYIKIEIEGAPFYINLDTVAIICRDRCKPVELTEPKKK